MDNRIRLSVVSQDGREMLFKAKPNGMLVVLLRVYCARKKLKFNEVRFFFDSKPINKKHTPAKLGMQDNDKIEAMMTMHGGGVYASGAAKKLGHCCLG